MGELRYNNINEKWVIISPERGGNRNSYLSKEISNTPETCPFCDKNGGINKKLHSLFTINFPDSSAAALIVTPNRYPALGIEGALERKGDGLHDKISTIGAHEIVIDSFKHGIDISGYKEEEINNLYTAFKYRILDLEKDIRFRFVSAFKNIGKIAGENIPHPHAQIIAMPIIPKSVEKAINKAVSYYKEKERCIYCDIISQEIRDKSRVIFENHEFISFVPYAAEHPFEISIFPKAHDSFFSDITDTSLRQLSDITFELFSRLNQVLDSPALSIALRLAPYINNRPDYNNNSSYIPLAFHWHIDIRSIVFMPSSTNWATNININPVAPEDAARYLRGL